MERKLTIKEYIFLASMIFGLFFGAGNLIFPVHMGQQAGPAVWAAMAGFCLTGVGLPLLGIAAIGASRREGLFQMGCLVGRKYSYFFTCALYLALGPLFATPRTATVSFAVGLSPLLPDQYEQAALCVFSALFFLVVLYFSLRPSGILVWVGKILNPLFLLFLGILMVTALLDPMGSISASQTLPPYDISSFAQGSLDGYNTLDAPAALIFGIILIHAIRGLGVQSSERVASSTLKAGLLGCGLMAVIYCMLAIIGAQSGVLYGISVDGGAALYLIGTHYFGPLGGVVLGITVTLACLKTAVGLVTACAEAFSELFPKRSYRLYAVLFSLFSFVVANFGLARIVQLSLPALMFLYPLTIVLILLCLFGRRFDYDRRVFLAVTICTLPAALLDLLNALPDGTNVFLHTAPLLSAAERVLPLFSIGMGWVVPALLGTVIGFALRVLSPMPRQ